LSAQQSTILLNRCRIVTHMQAQIEPTTTLAEFACLGFIPLKSHLRVTRAIATYANTAAAQGGDHTDPRRQIRPIYGQGLHSMNNA
jgi:hypothetical protein